MTACGISTGSASAAAAGSAPLLPHAAFEPTMPSLVSSRRTLHVYVGDSCTWAALHRNHGKFHELAIAYNVSIARSYAADAP